MLGSGDGNEPMPSTAIICSRDDLFTGGRSGGFAWLSSVVAAPISASRGPICATAFASTSESLELVAWPCSRPLAIDMLDEESKRGVLSLFSCAMVSGILMSI
jgi:hypothetical protein